VLYYLQRLRDEAHRFAISAHRAGRSKALTKSELDEIPGVGSAIKRRLLNHFGSARGVRQAGLADLEACPGIGPAVARRVHGHFHPGAAGPVEAAAPTRGRRVRGTAGGQGDPAPSPAPAPDTPPAAGAPEPAASPAATVAPRNGTG
jgi:excinuclease ABC subunit C